jgi:hypothetical protein
MLLNSKLNCSPLQSLSTGFAWLVMSLVPLVGPAPETERPAARAEEAALASWSPEELARRERIARCLATYYLRPVDADELRPWSIMHGLIAYGQDTEIVARGQTVNAVVYLCGNGAGNDKRLMEAPQGRLHLQVGPGYQGHAAQFLAMLAQSHVPTDQPMQVDGHAFTVADLIEYEMRKCRSGTELTFQLMALSHYLDSEAVWTSDDGQQWSIARLLREEMAQPINAAACGGTHRLMAISYAVARRYQQGYPFDTTWRTAARYIQDYHNYTLNLQNPDGSFSTEWFRERGNDNSAAKRLYTTGHILEWLAFSLPPERLTEPGVVRAVDYLTSLMLAAPGYELDIGPRGHALRALRLYEERVFGATKYQEVLPDIRQITGAPVPVRQATHRDSAAGSAASATPATWTRETGAPRGLFGRRR